MTFKHIVRDESNFVRTCNKLTAIQHFVRNSLESVVTQG